MKISFSKYHGLGNDFILINNLDNKIILSREEIARLCNRNFGIGADGLIFARTSDIADFFMDYYNSDGSIAEMCGNGIRCFAKYLYDEGLTNKEILDIETRAGVLSIELIFENSPEGKKQAIAAKVDMGEPILEPVKIPVKSNSHRVINEPFKIDDIEFNATCVSMGNPHCVIFVDDVKFAEVEKKGPAIETSIYFPQKTNVEFAHVASPNEIELRVWERGCGETLACGTGACATLVAANLNGLTEKTATIHLPGGDLLIDWADNNHVIMQGPAVKIFDGEIVL